MPDLKPEDQPIKHKRIIFKEIYEVLDSLAWATNNYFQTLFEEEFDINFRYTSIVGINSIKESKKRGRHPYNVIASPNPVLSLSYIKEVEYTDLVLGSSAFSNDLGCYISPRLTSDLLFENGNIPNAPENFEVRLQFSNVEMNCDVAILQDTELSQLSVKRAWDVLFESNKEYEVYVSLKFPISEQVIDYWCEKFKLDKNNYEEVKNHIQRRSKYQIEIEVQLSTSKKTYYLYYPTAIRMAFRESELRTDEEINDTIMNWIVHRQVNLKFNAPSIYWIFAKDRYPILDIKNVTGLIVNPFPLNVDKTSDTYNDMTLIIRSHLLFTNKKNVVAPIRSLFNEYEPFLYYLDYHQIPYKDAFYILARASDDEKQADSYITDPRIGVSYDYNFQIKIFDIDALINKSIDIKVYMNGELYDDYLQTLRNSTIHNRNDIVAIEEGIEGKDLDLVVDSSIEDLYKK